MTYNDLYFGEPTGAAGEDFKVKIQAVVADQVCARAHTVHTRVIEDGLIVGTQFANIAARSQTNLCVCYSPSCGRQSGM